MQEVLDLKDEFDALASCLILEHFNDVSEGSVGVKLRQVSFKLLVLDQSIV